MRASAMGLALTSFAAVALSAPPVRARIPFPSSSAQGGAVGGEASGEEGLSSGELDAMALPLAVDSIDIRRQAADSLSSLGASATVAITKKVAELRRINDAGTLVAVRTAKERAGRGSNADLLEALVALKPDENVTRALTTLCLLRALARTGTTAAVRQLVLAASDAEGVWRPELARQIKPLGERALAALIEARSDSSRETRSWAGALFASISKRAPADVVQTKDNQVLSDVLLAYASVKDPEALPVVLSFVNSDRVQVRAAARNATLAYGPEAQWKLREAYAALTGEQAPEGLGASELAKKVFDAYDRFRLRETYAALEKGLAAYRSGRRMDAITSFDEVLAQQPALDRRAETSTAYADYGESIEDKNRPAALAYLRKALRLDESGPKSNHVRSVVSTLEGEDSAAKGIADVGPFERALSLDSTNARARSDLDAINGRLQTGHRDTWRRVSAAIVFGLTLVAAVILGGRRRRTTTTSLTL